MRVNQPPAHAREACVVLVCRHLHGDGCAGVVVELVLAGRIEAVGHRLGRVGTTHGAHGSLRPQDAQPARHATSGVAHAHAAVVHAHARHGERLEDAAVQEWLAVQGGPAVLMAHARHVKALPADVEVPQARLLQRVRGLACVAVRVVTLRSRAVARAGKLRGARLRAGEGLRHAACLARGLLRGSRRRARRARGRLEQVYLDIVVSVFGLVFLLVGGAVLQKHAGVREHHAVRACAQLGLRPDELLLGGDGEGRPQLLYCALGKRRLGLAQAGQDLREDVWPDDGGGGKGRTGARGAQDASSAQRWSSRRRKCRQ